jgi:hypothetical protein
VQGFTEWLQQQPNGRGATLRPGTVRHHLNALSNLYRRAASERRVPSGYNPVRDMMDKPTARSREAKWLEVPDAALLLEAARRNAPEHREDTIPFLHALVGAFLLTGGLEARRDPLGDVPPHLLRGPAPDAGPGRTGVTVHRREGDGPRWR